MTPASNIRSGNFVFCYGSLRPDDDSGMPWTSQAVENLSAQRAVVLNAKLFQDIYASMVLQAEKTDSVVHGWVLSSDNDSFFQQKMSQFDMIEGVNEEKPELGLYQKDTVVARLLSPYDCIGEPIGNENELLHVFCYHRPDCSKTTLIESGDWMQRHRG